MWCGRIFYFLVNPPIHILIISPIYTIDKRPETTSINYNFPCKISQMTKNKINMSQKITNFFVSCWRLEFCLLRLETNFIYFITRKIKYRTYAIFDFGSF